MERVSGSPSQSVLAMVAVPVSETIQAEVGKYRAAIALHHALCVLRTGEPGPWLRERLIEMAAKLANDVVARKLPGTATVEAWKTCVHDMSSARCSDKESLKKARYVAILLADGRIDHCLVVDPERVRASIRAGIVAATLWGWRPFGEVAEGKDNDQVVPDVDDMASHARQIIQAAIACPTQESIRSCLDQSISALDANRAMKSFAETLQGARRSVDDPSSFAGR